jgi:formylglycine-generating enzyme required for sulfatase activity
VQFFVPRYTDGHVGSAPVGSFKKEKSGLFDLFGNVSEWVNDAYILMLPERGNVEMNPLKKTVGLYHVIKGPSFRSGTRTALRASYRDGLEGKRPDVGVRVGRYLYREFAKGE